VQLSARNVAVVTEKINVGFCLILISVNLNSHVWRSLGHRLLCDSCAGHHNPRSLELDLVLGRLKNSHYLGLEQRITGVFI
jgi:hypothetical protein